MSRVTVVQPLNTTPTAAWALLGDPAGISDWHPAIVGSPVDGDVRTVNLADGAVLREQILSHDDHTRTYRYAIVEGPLPVADYQGTLEVVATEGGAEARWSAEFRALAPEEEVVGMLRGIFGAGLEAARDRLEA